jgi:hypothetical protein
MLDSDLAEQNLVKHTTNKYFVKGKMEEGMVLEEKNRLIF